MSMTQEAQFWHSKYEAADPDVQEMVDNAYGAVRARLRHGGIEPNNSDPAEELVAAIMKYIEQSRVTADGIEEDNG